jgi:hypothetical protein
VPSLTRMAVEDEAEGAKLGRMCKLSVIPHQEAPNRVLVANSQLDAP